MPKEAGHEFSPHSFSPTWLACPSGLQDQRDDALIAKSAPLMQTIMSREAFQPELDPDSTKEVSENTLDTGEEEGVIEYEALVRDASPGVFYIIFQVQGRKDNAPARPQSAACGCESAPRALGARRAMRALPALNLPYPSFPDPLPLCDGGDDCL